VPFSTFQVPTATELNDLILYTVTNLQTTDFPTTTSGTYVSLGIQCGQAFTAPASGVVKIDWAAELKTGTAAQVAAATIEVRTGAVVGSGTVVYAASDSNPLAQNTNTNIATAAAMTPVTGLTPGASYNARLMFRSNGTATLTGGRRVINITGTN
jgi:hypothetical protein